jgi:hypothetical protein
VTVGSQLAGGTAGRALQSEPGSFRDPHSRVLRAGNEIYRALSEQGLADFQVVAKTEFWARVQEDGRVVRTELVPPEERPVGLGPEWPGLLRHERVPFVSYPYEWPFGMLRDAALLQLGLLAEALEEGLVLKDSTPYNVQWRGAQPTFVDVGSFEPHGEAEAWTGYRQFCMLYLYPLLLQAYKGVAPHAWLRGSLDGIPPDQMARLFDGGAKLKRGVMTHITMHARLEERYGDRRRDVKQELKEAGFSRELVKANVRKMNKLVDGLHWDPPKGVWTEYGRVNTYTDEEAEAKAAFVRSVAAERRPALAWDLGCNDGRYSRIVADEGARVVAVDSDQGPVELLYRDLRAERDDRVLPLTMNLTDPSPGLGWNGAERRPLAARGRPDLVLCLALVHHVTITANVPMRAWLDWLAELGAPLVIEFPTREDPMVQRLLAAKKAGTHDDYGREAFERCLAEAFEVERSEPLASGTRVLHLATPRRRPAGA